MRCPSPDCRAENPPFASRCLRCGADLATRGTASGPVTLSGDVAGTPLVPVSLLDAVLSKLNDPHFRSLVAGALGGFVGWLCAELLVRGPQSFGGTLVFGILAGGGIGGVLGSAEGLLVRSLALAKRGGVIAIAIGVTGGAIGACFGQAGYAMLRTAPQAGAGGSFFSPELKRRLDEAGARAGAIEIALIWENRNDLDLHVVDPAGEHINYGHRQSVSGGELDVDRNAACTGNVTDQPVEHVVWSRGAAPMGSFRVLVHHYSNCGVRDPTPFRVEVVRDGKHESMNGAVSHRDPPLLVGEFTRTDEPIASGSGGFFARLFGWTVFGTLVGCGQGFVRKSAQALCSTALGGCIGGTLGGVAFEVLTRSLSTLDGGGVVSRAVGLVILGACIGLCVALVTTVMSATLRVLSGRFEGRQIILDRREIRIGRSDALEVYLGGDPVLAPHHATLVREAGGYVVRPAAGSVTVNGQPVTRNALKNGDELTLGNTRLRYRA